MTTVASGVDQRAQEQLEVDLVPDRPVVGGAGGEDRVAVVGRAAEGQQDDDHHAGDEERHHPRGRQREQPAPQPRALRGPRGAVPRRGLRACTVATQLAFTSVHTAARRWISSVPRRRKTFSFSRSEISTLQAGTSLARSANAGSASFTGNG